MALLPDKVCRKCGEAKPISEFREFRNKGKISGRRHVCRKCERWKPPKGYGNKYHKTKPYIDARKKYRESEHGKRKERDSHFRRKYNITLEQYDKMAEQQKGLCILCGLPEIGRRLAVDHNHQTGKVRGLLCHQCNCCIGFIENKNLSIKKIQKYLEI